MLMKKSKTMFTFSCTRARVNVDTIAYIKRGLACLSYLADISMAYLLHSTCSESVAFLQHAVIIKITCSEFLICLILSMIS